VCVCYPSWEKRCWGSQLAVSISFEGSSINVANCFVCRCGRALEESEDSYLRREVGLLEEREPFKLPHITFPFPKHPEGGTPPANPPPSPPKSDPPVQHPGLCAAHGKRGVGAHNWPSVFYWGVGFRCV
jgi:hypothetical protein